ncbi:kinesin-like protein KIN-14D, partial [Biomphalaria pfeifferi]
MGSGASKNNSTQQTPRTQGTPRRPQATTNRGGHFQEVELQAPGQGRTSKMSSRSQQSTPRTTPSNQQTRYARHSTNPNGSLHHGQSTAATSRENRRTNEE